MKYRKENWAEMGLWILANQNQRNLNSTPGNDLGFMSYNKKFVNS